MKKTNIELVDGTEIRLNLANTILKISIANMYSIVDVGSPKQMYSWDWLVSQVLKENNIEASKIKDYKELYEKVKSAFHLIKNPNYSGFYCAVDTYKTKALGTRIVKMSASTPEEFRKKLTIQKKDRLMNHIDSFNTRLSERNRQLGFSGNQLEYDKNKDSD